MCHPYKAHDVDTVPVFFSELVKWKLSTILLAGLGLIRDSCIMGIYSTPAHFPPLPSAIPSLSLSFAITPIPTHLFTCTCICISKKCLLNTYRVPGWAKRDDKDSRSEGHEILLSASNSLSSRHLAPPSFPLTLGLSFPKCDPWSTCLESPGAEVKRWQLGPAQGTELEIQGHVWLKFVMFLNT